MSTSIAFPVEQNSPSQHGANSMRFQVEVDKSGQVHVRCVQGKEVVLVIGLSQAGFKSLFGQGFMRKPHALQVGALHDWVELDGHFFSFEKGNNDAAKLEATLNEQYLPVATSGEGDDIIVYANPASATGFDIQFPVSRAGMRETKRRPLNEESIELLQDPVRCGLLHKNIVIKVTRPYFVFKLKTPDGGERYLESSPDNLVPVIDEDGNAKAIDLSHPVNYSHLSTGELTSVFNHPTINKHGRTAAQSSRPAAQENNTVVTPREPHPTPQASPEAVPPPALESRPIEKVHVTQEVQKQAVVAPEPKQPPLAPPPAEAPAPRPNSWLKPVFDQSSIRHDWFTCLVYSKIAEWLRSSNPGKLGAANCWSIALDDAEDISDPNFKGIFLTEKGGFGYLNQGHIVRFNKGVVLVGTQDAAIEGIGVLLIAAGFDIEGRTVFIVTEDYISKFGIPEKSVRQELANLKEFGGVIMSAREALESTTPLDVMWTVPAAQENLEEPKSVESRMAEESDE